MRDSMRTLIELFTLFAMAVALLAYADSLGSFDCQLQHAPSHEANETQINLTLKEEAQ